MKNLLEKFACSSSQHWFKTNWGHETFVLFFWNLGHCRKFYFLSFIVDGVWLFFWILIAGNNKNHFDLRVSSSRYPFTNETKMNLEKERSPEVNIFQMVPEMCKITYWRNCTICRFQMSVLRPEEYKIFFIRPSYQFVTIIMKYKRF